jgi:hypothetical protein
MKWTILGWLVMLVVGMTFTLAALMPRDTDTALPLAGEWTLTLNPNALATCLNRRTFQLPTARFVRPTTYTGSLSLLGDDSFRFQDDVFTRIPDTSRFTGFITLADGTRAQIQFVLVAARRMTGQLVTAYRVDTTHCSQSIPLTFERGE